ncbi:MAG: hypothetical protein DDT19_02812 [Syntrophomonadaceae bacterium]|nr:hypothetical protein [Bacillota bacterium]
MKVFRDQKEVNTEIKDGVLHIDGSVVFECPIEIRASIIAKDIWAHDIKAENIIAKDIVAHDITAWNITAGNIVAVSLWAWDIKAESITALDISYYAFCCVYDGIRCCSIKARRVFAHEPISLKKEVRVG